MFNNDDDNENNNNIEKIAYNDVILNKDYSFKDEEDCDEAIIGDSNSEDSEENSTDNNILILNKLSEERNNNDIGSVLVKYQTILRDVRLDE